MSALFVVIPLALAASAAAVVAFAWAARTGQFDDLETPAARALTDDPSWQRMATQRPRRKGNGNVQ